MERQKQEDHDRIVALLPVALREILDRELAGGNEILESWDTWGIVVLLKERFAQLHPTEAPMEFVILADPHYWLAEYRVGETMLACSFGAEGPNLERFAGAETRSP